MFFLFPLTPAGIPSAQSSSSASGLANMKAWFGFPSEFSECCFRTPRHPNRCLDFYYRHRTPARPDGSTAGGDAVRSWRLFPFRLFDGSSEHRIERFECYAPVLLDLTLAFLDSQLRRFIFELPEAQPREPWMHIRRRSFIDLSWCSTGLNESP